MTEISITEVFESAREKLNWTVPGEDETSVKLCLPNV